MPSRLSIAIVTYAPDAELLRQAVASLRESAVHAREAGLLSQAALYLVDNGPADAAVVVDDAASRWDASLGPAAVLRGHGNVGYGAANNRVLPRLDSDVHLVMNPDVAVEREALAAVLATLRDRPGIGLVAPAARDGHGDTLYLAKRHPSPWVLFLRGFAPAFLRRRNRAALDRYELRDVIGDRYADGIPLASGCFMPVRTALFRAIGGFDPAYFLYFEDFDLSVRLRQHAQIAYVPDVRIVHHGGHAARKGLRHVLWFITSARRFFARHGSHPA